MAQGRVTPTDGARGNRSGYPVAVDHLINELARLPGIGRRSAERLALHLLKATTESALNLAKAIEAVKSSIRHCAICYNLADVAPATSFNGDPAGPAQCAICQDAGRDRHAVMVVEEPRDVLSIEATGLWRGLYHVLLGRIAPLEGVTAGDLTIAALIERLTHPAANAGGVAIRDVVLGLNPTLESDGTGLYLAEEIRKIDLARAEAQGAEAEQLHVTRLARGLPAGSSLQFASKAVLADALRGRQNVSGG